MTVALHVNAASLFRVDEPDRYRRAATRRCRVLQRDRCSVEPRREIPDDGLSTHIDVDDTEAALREFRLKKAASSVTDSGAVPATSNKFEMRFGTERPMVFCRQDSATKQRIETLAHPLSHFVLGGALGFVCRINRHFLGKARIRVFRV